MKADPRNTLPLSTTAAFTPAVRRPRSDGTHWARALASAAAPAEALPVQKVDGALPAKGAHSRAAGLPPAPRTRQDACDGGQRTGAATLASGPGDSSGEGVRSSVVQPAFATPPATASTPEPAADADAPARVARKPLSTRPGESAPVRIHMEQHAAGLAVWLGVDAHLGGQAVAALLKEFKQQCRGRLPIASIVCNGSTVYAPPSSSKEIP